MNYKRKQLNGRLYTRDYNYETILYTKVARIYRKFLYLKKFK